MSPSEDFNQIKRDLVTTVNEIKSHIDDEAIQREEIKILLGKVSVAIFGDPMANPPIEGYHARLERIEKERQAEKREKQDNKNNVINLAVGSVAIALGGAICWIALAVKAFFLKGH